MKSTSYTVIVYDADEGKVFDWKKPRFRIDGEGNQIQEHLYAKQISVGRFDSIDNYVEVDAPTGEGAAV